MRLREGRGLSVESSTHVPEETQAAMQKSNRCTLKSTVVDLDFHTTLRS
jgi:hypothetical protein